MKKAFLLLVFISILFSCSNSKKSDTITSKKSVITQVHPGKKLMETNCYVCHNPSSSEKNRIGPPMIAIKKHYINDNISKDEFIASMQKWIKNPNKEDAKMFGAVKRFGVMPKQYFPEETIKQIADYMFTNNIEQPDWFEEHHNKEKGNHKNNSNKSGNKNVKKETSTKSQELSYKERGLKYALATKAVLGKNLMGKIQKEGTLSALEFCNIKAYPLTDSMAVAQNASIKRVSDKPRNLKNKANKKEVAYINIFKEDAIANKESSPIVEESATKVNVYYPIKTNGMCLQCHGKPNDQIATNSMAAIKKLYPNDMAIGYDINQIRGIWNVSFDKN